VEIMNLTATRLAWHGVAELVLAGPQFRRSGTIRLRVTPGGFATVAAPDLRVDREWLVAGEDRVPLNGSTCAKLADAAGVDVGRPEGLYAGGSGVGPGERLDVAPDAAAYLAGCFERGAAALQGFAPQERPVLWPEHFDVGISVDEINYGVSPGDSSLDEPYAYVGPWRTRSGEFWNAPFGAARPMRELPDVDAVTEFFRTGRDLAAAS
jgi:hypothetical protein